MHERGGGVRVSPFMGGKGAEGAVVPGHSRLQPQGARAGHAQGLSNVRGPMILMRHKKDPVLSTTKGKALAC